METFNGKTVLMPKFFTLAGARQLHADRLEADHSTDQIWLIKSGFSGTACGRGFDLLEDSCFSSLEASEYEISGWLLVLSRAGHTADMYRLGIGSITSPIWIIRGS